MDGRSRIAWNLRRLRTEQGLSQEALAVDANVDRGYISGIEQRKFNPTIDVLDQLANALSVDVSALIAVPEGDAPLPLPPGRKSTKV